MKAKYEALRSNPFSFLRGTCHLFYEGMPNLPILRNAPAVWTSGDLHLENFGSYKGDNRLVYFDINDFDESQLAPCTLELGRFLTSVLLARQSLKIKRVQSMELCKQFLNAYVAAVQDGKPRWLEREVAEGLVRELLEKLRTRKRKEFLDKHSRVHGEFPDRRIIQSARAVL